MHLFLRQDSPISATHSFCSDKSDDREMDFAFLALSFQINPKASKVEFI